MLKLFGLITEERRGGPANEKRRGRLDSEPEQPGLGMNQWPVASRGMTFRENRTEACKRRKSPLLKH